MMHPVLFSSANQEWGTPQDLFDTLDAEFHFTLDVCATGDNAKVCEFIPPQADALKQSWQNEVCWMNPPYGRRIICWVRKAYHEALSGTTVVCLLPARTDTRWFHQFCVHGEIRFLAGRLRFVGAPDRAPFPSMVVIFRPEALMPTHRVRLRKSRTIAGRTHKPGLYYRWGRHGRLYKSRASAERQGRAARARGYR